MRFLGESIEAIPLLLLDYVKFELLFAFDDHEEASWVS